MPLSSSGVYTPLQVVQVGQGPPSPLLATPQPLYPMLQHQGLLLLLPVLRLAAMQCEKQQVQVVPGVVWVGWAEDHACPCKLGPPQVQRGAPQAAAEGYQITPWVARGWGAGCVPCLS
jgi:hypothetical protein